ncbi:hypothetical protein BBJ28_00025524, partial [Nothophytophthora sp. Chile5]
MIVPSKSLFASALAATLAVAVVNGHGYMSDPAVTFTSSAGDPTQFIATIESSASGLSGTFNGAPADNVASFTTAFDSSSYTSLKEFINDKATITVTDATLTCGSCDPAETAQPLPTTYVEWAHSDSEGFTASHEGPCEVWCDDVRVFQDDDCAAHYTTAPAEMPYDHDACLGSSVLTFYWMAMHSSTWQVYVNCAPLETTTSTGATSSYAVGSSSATTTSNTTTTTTTTAPATTTATPAVTTVAPTTTTTAPTATTAAPTTTTSAPAATTAAPTTADDSDCGSLDVAGEEDSDCGSLDVAGSDESDCGSLDVAGEGDSTSPSTSTSTTTTESPSTSTKQGSSPSTSTTTTTTAPSTTTSSEGEVAGDADSEVAGEADTTTADSECGSLDMAEDSECGSLEMAE